MSYEDKACYEATKHCISRREKSLWTCEMRHEGKYKNDMKLCSPCCIGHSNNESLQVLKQHIENWDEFYEGDIQKRRDSFRPCCIGNREEDTRMCIGNREEDTLHVWN